LVEVCPWNLLQYSEQIDNGVWTKFSPTSVTADTTTAPNGTATADTISTSATAVIRQTVTLNANETYTYSVYVKKISYDFFGFQSLISGTGVKSVFDLSNGTVTSQGSGHTASIESVGNGWYRCIITFNVGSSASNIFDLAADGTSATLRTFYAWGAQSNIGSTAKPYFPTTDRLNVPRLTYQNGGGGCPSLLLEKQSTNLLTWSEDFTNANWGINAAATRVANTAISPDGTQNADSIGANGGVTASIYQNISASGSGVYSVSIYAKKNTNRYFKLVITGGASNSRRYGIIVDLQDGSFVTALNTSTALTNTSYSIISAGNGWYRIAVTATVPSSSDVFIVLDNTNSSSNATNALTLDYNFPSVGNSYYWGAQAEASSYPTSYIPTTSASATRVADACFKTGISSLVGASEYTLFWDGSHIPTGQYNSFMTIYQTSNENNSARFYRNNTNNEVRAAIFNQANTLVLDMGSSVTAQRIKCALRVKNADFAFFVNGVKVNNNSTALAPSSVLDSVNLQYFNDTQSFGQNCSMACFFKTALVDAECISLTTI
jgi:hypothetical protein